MFLYCCVVIEILYFYDTFSEKSKMEHHLDSCWVKRANEKINGGENGDNVQRKGGARRGIDRQIATKGAVPPGGNFSLFCKGSPDLGPSRQVAGEIPVSWAFPA